MRPKRKLYGAALKKRDDKLRRIASSAASDNIQVASPKDAQPLVESVSQSEVEESVPNMTQEAAPLKTLGKPRDDTDAVLQKRDVEVEQSTQSGSRKRGRKRKILTGIAALNAAKKAGISTPQLPMPFTMSQTTMPPPVAATVPASPVEVVTVNNYFDEVGDLAMANLEVDESTEHRLRVPQRVADITEGYLDAQFYDLAKYDLMDQYHDPTSQLNVNSVFGYMMYVAYLAQDVIKSLLINIGYTIAVFNNAPVSSTIGAWGDRNRYEVLFLPIYFPGHFALVIHERKGRTVLYDPLPNKSRFDNDNARYLPAIKDAIREFDPFFASNDAINIEVADAASYNVQRDGYNCGYYVSLYVETYLMNDKRMLLADFNIATERQRINGMLFELCHGRVPQYETRHDDPFHYVEVDDVVDDEMPVVQCVSPVLSDSDVSVTSVSSTDSRRSTRSGRGNVNYSERRKNTKRNLKPLKHCRKRHGGYGCFAKCAKHVIEYLDCQSLGKKVCKYCQALLFEDEGTTMCCKNGDVVLPHIRPVPDEIRQLATDAVHGKHFLQHFRIYNMLLRFGSVEAGRKKAPGVGPPVLLINGEIKRNISPLFASDGKTPVHGQLYMLDPMMMHDAVARDPLYPKFGIRREILEKLFAVLRRYHPLCEAFQVMHTLYKEKLAEVREQGFEDVQHVTLVLVNPTKVPDTVADPGLHPHTVTLPQVKEMCAFYVTNEQDQPLYRHGTWLRKNDGRDVHMPLFHQANDMAHYVLNLVHGDPGYHEGIEKRVDQQASKRRRLASATDDAAEQNEIGSSPDAIHEDEDESQDRKYVSIREFYRYHLAIRGDDPTAASHFLLPYGSIVQEYIIDQSMKADQQVYQYLQKNAEIFCTTAPEVREALERDLQRLDENKKLGKVIRLSSRMVGSPAWYQQKFHDAMALFQRKGKATFMITSTSNPGWREIKEHLMKGQKATDRPDIVNRVFFVKINKMRRLIEDKQIFGRVNAFTESLEFQKRGGPHTHRLISLDCPNTSEYVDEYISAEIPHLPRKDDKSDEAEVQRKLRDLVVKYQIHNCSSYCLNDKGQCNKRFPKKFSNETIIYEDRPAQYKRRSPDDGGAVYRTPKGHVITNASVVPYNPAYLFAWNGHSNLEFAYGNNACKYAVKYSFKVGNYAYVQINNRNNPTVDYDETVGMMKGHYRSAPEAHSMLYSFRAIRLSHTVYRLHVHLPGKGPLYFRRGHEDALAAKVLDNNVRLSQLEMFMVQCSEEFRRDISIMRNLTFAQLPETHWFNRKSNRWVKRKRLCNVIGRLYPVQPGQVELFAVYQLVICRKGPLNWEDLRTPFGHTTPCETFVECAKLMGLLEDIEIWRRTLFEASNVGNPRMMRNLFAQILLCGHVSDPLELWNEFLPHMYDTRNLRENDDREKSKRINIALCLLNRLLSRRWRTNADYHIPMPTNYEFVCNDERDFFFGHNRALDDEDLLDPTVTLPSENVDEDIETENVANYVNLPEYQRLNVEQRRIVDAVIKAIEINPTVATTTNVPRLIFMSGAGGTGKTFVYKTLIDICVKYTKYVLVTASTGVAAQLLPRATTVHSAFQLPIDVISTDYVPPISYNSIVAYRIRKAELLIIDEISMLHKNLFKMVNEACKHAAAGQLSNFAFGGKVVLIGGDWRQLLPVVAHGDLHDQVRASIKNSELFASFEEIELTRNMRVNANEVEFVDLLERIGKNADGSGTFRVPSEMFADSEEDLLKFVFPTRNSLSNVDEVADRLILTARRVDVRELNRKILNLMPGEERVYLSADKSLVDNPVLDVHAAVHDVVYLNDENPSGFPPHRLVLKLNCLVILLRNIDVKQGLSNGTRLIVTDMGQNLLYCRIAVGPRRGKSCVLSMLPFTYEDRRVDGTGLHFERMQFPVELAYAMTINKAQGQTVNKVGILLKTPLFSHGQLYVAMSRVRTKLAVKICAPRINPRLPCTIKNIVATNIFS